MRVIMVMVCTINGKITKGDNPNIYSWTSQEDRRFFFDLLTKYKVKIMGSRTYDAVKSKIKLQKGHLRIILTRNPEKYKSDIIPDKLEFSDESPVALLRKLKNKGIKQVLLLGGGKINSSFLKEKLVQELYLTIEPKIFGKGKPIFDKEIFSTNLELTSIRKLNKRGTLLLKYRFSKYDRIDV